MNNQLSIEQDNFEIGREDPLQLFSELTEIGHGHFGAVYYVMIFLIFFFHIGIKYPSRLISIDFINLNQRKMFLLF